MGVPAPRNKLQAWLSDPIGQVTGPIGDTLGAAYNQLASYPSIGAAMDAADQWGSNAAQQMQAPMYDRTSGGLTPKGQEYANLLAGFTGTSLAGKAPGITAFHGSPHSFDKFSTSAIGTGEGAQAYGHGLYFAGEEGVARSYRDALTQPPLPIGFRAAQNDYNDKWNRVGALYGRNAPKADISAAIAERDVAHAKLQEMQKADVPGPQGHMYEVGINANPDHFLDWDKPLSQQHPVVQDALAQHGISADSKRAGDNTYSDLVRKIADNPADYGMAGYTQPSDVVASQALQQAGIPGIKYLDGNSRTAGQGSHNYVVFDDNTIDILKKYGIAGLGLGGAAATQGGDPTQPDPNAQQASQ